MEQTKRFQNALIATKLKMHAIAQILNCSNRIFKIIGIITVVVIL